MSNNTWLGTEPIAAASDGDSQSQKRVPRRDRDESDGENDGQTSTLPSPLTAPQCSGSGAQSKRFKGIQSAALPAGEEASSSLTWAATCDDGQPAKTTIVRASRFILDDFHAALSPITEISNNLSDTQLDTPEDADREPASDANNTPLKGWRNALRVGGGGAGFGHSIKGLQKTSDGNTRDVAAAAEATASQHLADKSADFQSNFQLASRHVGTAAMRGSPRRLLMDGSLHEMAVDELSFYEDEDDTTASSPARRPSSRFAAVDSPPMMSLLLPETSPQRFQIIDRQSSAAKFRQPTMMARTTTTTLVRGGVAPASGTPSKSFRMFHSLSSGSMESSMDDEYMELFEMESLEQQLDAEQPQQQQHAALNFPSDLNSLISGQIKHASPGVLLAARTPDLMRRPTVRRCLSMSENLNNSLPHAQQPPQPKTPETAHNAAADAGATTPFASRLNAGSNNTTPASSQAGTPTTIGGYCFKRPEPPSTSCSPVLTKRHRGEEKENVAIAPPASAPAPCRPPLRKSMSMNDAEILTALARCDNTNEPDLIGDFSKPFALPLMDGRHRDLKSVSSETVARLLRGEFVDQVASYSIVDCRYPYEFEGGHIRGAKNLYTQEQIVAEFLAPLKTDLQQAKSEPGTTARRHIVIFHCEFSSERGPKLSRFLRNNDRARNTNAYPALDYPEVYLLHNGYKEFYETHRDLCDPIAYRPMLEPAYGEAYRHFRAKSKSWNGDGLGGGTSRMKKSRSRLLL